MSTLVSIKLYDPETGIEKELFPRKGNRNYFMESFIHKNYEINLRLDYQKTGYSHDKEPILDADIRNIETRKMLPKKEPWHHTKKSYDPKVGMETYLFEFEGLELRLIVKRTMAKTFTLDVVLVKK